MQIILVRHGPPDFNINWLMPTDGALHALESYAASRVTKMPLGASSDFKGSIDSCVTSELARAIDSAQLLGFKNSVASELFNESEIPYPNRLLIPLPWKLFLLIYRVLWFLGFKQNCAGKLNDVKRARQGGRFLSERAANNGSVLLVGHGIMNRLICAELQRSGWQLDKKTGSGYWSSITLSLQSPVSTGAN